MTLCDQHAFEAHWAGTSPSVRESKRESERGQHDSRSKKRWGTQGREENTRTPSRRPAN
ncbi:hypothetical protein C8T65DRAFT_666224 [Cerioporus squamosus]|nr:hypothetical protein C8T65DRAFT_666224 [Cerioporus squamosus]